MVIISSENRRHHCVLSQMVAVGIGPVIITAIIVIPVLLCIRPHITLPHFFLHFDKGKQLSSLLVCFAGWCIM